jgi:hypothetical protein
MRSSLLRTQLPHPVTLAAALVAALVVSGCGGDPTSPSQPTPAIGNVSTDGATLQVPGGGVQLVFPAGAVTGATAITAEPSVQHAADATIVPGTAFDFGPDGTQFAQPVQLTIAYDPTRLPAGTVEGTLAVHKWFPDGWRLIPGGTVDVANRKVSAPIHSFSIYAIRPVEERAAAAHEGDGQDDIAGAAVAVAPAVLVRTPEGQPLVGVAVTFAVTAGDGSVEGASAVTNAEGVARVGAWVLGAAPGVNTLAATVAGASVVTFGATGRAACDHAPAYAVGATATGDLAATDCLDASGRRADYRTITVAGELSATLTMTSSAFTPLVSVTTVDGTSVVTQYAASPGFTRAVLAPGTYRLVARAVETTGVGAYTVTVAAASHDVAGCALSNRVFMSVGATAEGTLASGDCADEVGSPDDRVDTYSVWLTAGATYRATLTGTPRAKLSLWGPTESATEIKELAAGPSSASILYTATTSGWHTLHPLGVAGTAYELGIATAEAVAACEQAPAYTIGSAVEGYLTSRDCLDETGRRADYRTLVVPNQLSATLTMAGGGFTPMVSVTTADGAPVVTQYSASAGFTRAVLAPGSYRIVTRAVETTGQGWYSLNVAAASHDVDGCGAATDVFLGVGTSHEGAITGGDCADDVGLPGDRLDAYSVWLRAGHSYRAALAATPAAKMSLWGPNGTTTVMKDLASGPEAADMTFVPSHDGWHTLYAIGPVGTDYQIAVSEIPAVEACSVQRPYALGSTALGLIADGDCVGTGDLRVDRYALTTTSQRSLTLTLGSDGFTPLVGVEDASGAAVVTQYTSSPGFTRAVLAPGTYRLTARATTPEARGVYWMTVAEGSHAADGCGVATNVFITPGATDAGQLGAADCADDFGDPTHRYDTYAMRMVAGTTYTIGMTTSAASWLSLWAPDATGAPVFDRMVQASGPETVTLTYTAVRTGWHNFHPGGAPGATYQVSVASTPPASASRTRTGATAPSLRIAAPLAAPQLTAPVRGTPQE